jgi:hypothetical protein
MRARSSEWDLPDGVHDLADAAATIIANLRHRAATLKLHRAPLPLEKFLDPPEARRRRRLLTAARHGNKRAHARLWSLYRCRLLSPVAPRPRLSKRHPS